MTTKPEACPMCGRWPDRDDLTIEIGCSAQFGKSKTRDDYYIIAYIQCIGGGDGCRCGGNESYFDLDSTPDDWWEEAVKTWNHRDPPEPVYPEES